MADIVYRYVEMRNAATEIESIANRYKAAADTFVEDFIAATNGWEGESHDKMIAFINGAVSSYAQESIPKLVGALAELLNENANQMEKVDQQIAENIPDSQ